MGEKPHIAIVSNRPLKLPLTYHNYYYSKQDINGFITELYGFPSSSTRNWLFKQLKIYFTARPELLNLSRELYFNNLRHSIKVAKLTEVSSFFKRQQSLVLLQTSRIGSILYRRHVFRPDRAVHPTKTGFNTSGRSKLAKLSCAATPKL